eukprot:CAMPEP_0185830780 /NCGR_PEP_ID=MMETSP1353-20130828/1081_1 /TAXON_ID=1077150 /ORGANISM="Erythrolobus australicus, Strain CCMP3124" /LENGTH=55 /DNA_ID=CAMNT_0028528759 /DNA_START=6 /DNA_END=173 /DNA_ORIENTATION=-
MRGEDRGPSRLARWAVTVGAPGEGGVVEGASVAKRAGMENGRAAMWSAERVERRA